MFVTGKVLREMEMPADGGASTMLHSAATAVGGSACPAAAPAKLGSASESTVTPLCCFYLAKGRCKIPATARVQECIFQHIADDHDTPCCFGATCRMGHAKRALPASEKEQAEFWVKFNENGVRVGARPSDRDATLLRSQLEPWPTPALRRRLEVDFGHDPDTVASLGRAQLMDALLAGYAQGGKYARRTVRVTGTPVRMDLIQEIMKELVLWAASHQQNDRPSISATNYTILRSPAEFSTKDSKLAQRAAAKLQQYARLWQLAVDALSDVDADFAKSFSALAVTKNFKGSPHIDKQNTGAFYGLSMGSFPEGQGGVCVEVNAFVVAHVNTRNRLGRVDGRFPHWVAPYDAGTDRYSLIYYRTIGDYEPPNSAIFGVPYVEDDDRRSGGAAAAPPSS